MNKNRFAKTMAVAAGLAFLSAVPGLARADSAQHGAMQTPKAASPRAQAKADSLPAGDFAGLDYTDEQKAAIAKIRQDAETRRTVVAKDDKLTSDQKNAMIEGYTRMEYGEIFRVLTPTQQKLVRQRLAERRAADQKAHKKQPPAG